ALRCWRRSRTCGRRTSSTVISGRRSASTRRTTRKRPPPGWCRSEHLDDLSAPRGEPVEGRGPVRLPTAHPPRVLHETEREDALAEVARIESAPEDRLVGVLQLGEREALREQAVDDVRVLELVAQALHGVADHLAVIEGERRELLHRMEADPRVFV